MAIALDDARLMPVKNDIRRALAAGYHDRVFTEKGLLDSLRQSYAPEIAWTAGEVSFDDLVKSMDEFKAFFATMPSPAPEQAAKQVAKADLK